MSARHALSSYTAERLELARDFVRAAAKPVTASRDEPSIAHTIGWLCGYQFNDSPSPVGAEVDAVELGEMLGELLEDVRAALIQLDSLTGAGPATPKTEFERLLLAAETAAAANPTQARILLDIAIASKSGAAA